MSRRQRIDPRRIKIHLSYTIEELARLLGCHKQSVRNWLKQGLSTLNDGKRPLLIQGFVARAFLEARRRGTTQRCKPEELYCFSCREPRTAVQTTLRLEPIDGTPPMLSGLCSICGTRMFKRVSVAAAAVLQEQTEAKPKAGAQTLKQAA